MLWPVQMIHPYWFLRPFKKTVTQNHRPLEVGKDLQRWCPTPLPKQNHLGSLAQECNRGAVRRTLHSLGRNSASRTETFQHPPSQPPQVILQSLFLPESFAQHMSTAVEKCGTTLCFSPLFLRPLMSTCFWWERKSQGSTLGGVHLSLWRSSLCRWCGFEIPDKPPAEGNELTLLRILLRDKVCGVKKYMYSARYMPSHMPTFSSSSGGLL